MSERVSDEQLAGLDGFKFDQPVSCAWDPTGAARAVRTLRAAVRAQQDEIERLYAEVLQARTERDQAEHIVVEVQRLRDRWLGDQHHGVRSAAVALRATLREAMESAAAAVPEVTEP